MAHDPGTESGGNRPSDNEGRQDASTRLDTRGGRTFTEDIGYVGSILCLVLGVVGALVATGAFPITLLFGGVELSLWVLMVLTVCVGLIASGIVGMERWDYYSQVSPR